MHSLLSGVYADNGFVPPIIKLYHSLFVQFKVHFASHVKYNRVGVYLASAVS